MSKQDPRSDPRFERIGLTRYATGEGNQQSVVKVQTDILRREIRREFRPAP